MVYREEYRRQRSGELLCTVTSRQVLSVILRSAVRDPKVSVRLKRNQERMKFNHREESHPLSHELQTRR